MTVSEAVRKIMLLLEKLEYGDQRRVLGAVNTAFPPEPPKRILGAAEDK